MANAQNRILWWALVASLGIYVAVAYVVRVPANPDIDSGLFFSMFLLLAVGTGAGSVFYRRFALSGPIQAGELDPTTDAGRQRAFQPFIVNLVLSESVGVYGLTLALLTGNPAFALGFGAGALALLVLHRPTAPDLVPPLSGHHRGIDSTPIA